MDEDLRKLLNVSLLKKSGLKISKIANMEEDDIFLKVRELSEANFQLETQLDTLTIAMMEMDEYKFDRVISQNIHEVGFEKTMLNVILPFLDKLNLLWLTGSVNLVQENFTSYVIRQKLISAIDNILPVDCTQKEKIFLYVPQGDKQELSLLFLHYLLKKRGFCSLYLGADVGLDDLRVAISIQKPKYIFSIINKPFRKISLEQYVKDSLAISPDAEWLFTGAQLMNIEFPLNPRAKVLNGLSNTLVFLDSIK